MPQEDLPKPGTRPSQEVRPEGVTLDRLYRACLQKFLSYSVIGAAVFVGYVQVAVSAHGSTESGWPSINLAALVFLLFFAFEAFALMAFRQFYLLSLLESDDKLGIRRAEMALTMGAAEPVSNISLFARWVSAGVALGSRSKVSEFLFVLLFVAGALVLYYAFTT